MQPSSFSCQPFTALFDLSREQIDGRSIDDYREWLVQTCKIFPQTIVFHDGCLNEFSLPNSKLIKIEVGMLEAFQLREQLRLVLGTFIPESPQDITFQIPDYALVQLSKFELAEKVLATSNCSSVIWIDAGISRFYPTSEFKNDFQDFVHSDLVGEFDYFFEIDTRKNLNLTKLRLKKPAVGTCKRVVSGTSFWVSRRGAEELAEAALDCARNWLSRGVWDNEQLILRYVLPELKGKKLYIRQGRRKTGEVSRFMAKNNKRPNKLASRMISFLMR